MAPDDRHGRGDPVLRARSRRSSASGSPGSWWRRRRPRSSPTGCSPRCDFASIGTNDLTQYTMAADRLLGTVANLQSPWHPAVLRLVADVGAAGAELGKPVGICGEAAADPLLAVVLVGLGATSLSMSPSALADVRASLARYSPDDAKALARAALAAEGAAEAKQAAQAAASDITTARATRVLTTREAPCMTTTSPRRSGQGEHASQSRGSARSCPSMIMPNIAAFIAWGIITAVLHPGRVHAERGTGRPRRPDDHLPAAAAHRQPGRAPRLRHPWRRGRLDRHGRRDRRHGHPDVPRRHDHGPARGVAHEAGRPASGRARSRPASRCWSTTSRPASSAFAPRDRGLLRLRPVVQWLSNGLEAAVDWLVALSLLPLLVDPRRARQGAVPEQRHQPRRVHADRHPAGVGDRQVDPVPRRGEPRSRPGHPARVHVLRRRHGAGERSRRDHHPVLRRHPRDLLPVRADEADASSSRRSPAA